MRAICWRPWIGVPERNLIIGYITQTLLWQLDSRRRRLEITLVPNYLLFWAAGQSLREKQSAVSRRVSDCPEYRQRTALPLGFTLMRSGRALTSAGLLCVCGCLKQNQLQNCHTPSASVEFSRDSRTFMDRETIKIDNEDSSSYTKQGNEINSGHFCVKFGCWLSSTKTLATRLIFFSLSLDLDKSFMRIGKGTKASDAQTRCVSELDEEQPT